MSSSGQSIFVLSTGDYDLRGVAGVFAMLEGAQRAGGGEWEQTGGDTWDRKRDHILDEGADIERFTIQ